MIQTLMISTAAAFAPASVTYTSLQGRSSARVRQGGPPSMMLHYKPPISTSTESSSYNNRKRFASSDSKLQVATTDKESNFITSSAADDADANALAKFTQGYQALTSKHYLAMAFLQAGVLASVADIATQSMEATSIDFGHVGAMATVAATMSGFMNAIWLRQLETAFPGTETKEVASKTIIHAIIIASIINSAYLAFVPLLTTYLYHDGGALDASGVFSSWNVDEFITLTKLEIAMFIPYNTLAFKYVPPSVRPLTHAAISATFNVAVSAVTLGYFDKWCENAMHLLS